MSEYIVTSPDGEKFRVTAPEGATEQQALAYAQQSFSKSVAPPQEAAPPEFQPEAPTGALMETPSGRMPGDAGKPTGDEGAGFAANFKAGFVDDPKLKAKFVADSLFPNDPDRYQRVGFRGGELVYKDDKGGFQAVDAGFLSGLGSFAADAPEMAGAGVGAAVGSITPAGPIGGAVTGAAIMDSVKRAFGQFILGDTQTPMDYAKGAATEGAFTLAGEGIARFGLSQFNRRAVRNAEKFDPAAADELIERTFKETGIRLDYAQVSNIRQLRDLKAWANKYPSEAAEIIDAQTQVQQGQVAEGIQRMLDAISAGDDPAKLSSSSVNAAKGIIAAAEESREAAVRDLYQAAYQDRIPTDAARNLLKDPVIRKTVEAVRKSPEYQRELGAIAADKEKLTFRGGVGPQKESLPTGMDSIRFWDLVKRNLDDQIETTQSAVTPQKNKGRLLTGAKQALVEATDAASPKYAAARAEFEKISAQMVDPLKDGIIGLIAKIDNPRLATSVATVANDILANPQLTKSTRTIFLSQGKRQEWADIVKLSLANKFDKAAKELASGEMGNVAGKFRASVIGTPRQKIAMTSALDGEALTAFESVMDALELIAKDRAAIGGSDTTFKQAITAQQMDAARPALERAATGIVTVLNPLEWRTALRERGQQKFLEENSVRLAEALTDPQKVRKLAELRKLPAGQERAALMLSAALGAWAGEEVQDLTADPPTQ